MKLGLIRCLQTEDTCPGTTDFKVVSMKKGAFEGIEEDIEIIGINTCGGCPGKKVVFRAKEMVRRGADAIALTSCITRGTPIGFVCPNAEQMLESLRSKLGDDIKIFEYTHK